MFTIQTSAVSYNDQDTIPDRIAKLLYKIVIEKFITQFDVCEAKTIVDLYNGRVPMFVKIISGANLDHVQSVVDEAASVIINEISVTEFTSIYKDVKNANSN